MKPTRERAIAALRAVLELCDREENNHEPFHYASRVTAERIRKVITDALDAEPGDTP